MSHARRTSLALGLLIGAASLVQAQVKPEGLELTASTDRDQVEVGGRFTLTVRLKNGGAEPVSLPKLAEDRQLVCLELEHEGGRAGFYEKIHPSPYDMKADWEKAELKPGETWQLQVDLFALTQGGFKITAHYGRWWEEYQKLVSEAEEKTKADPEDLAAKAKLTSTQKMKGVGELPHLVAAPVEVKLVAAASGAEDVSIRMLTSMGPIKMRLFPKDAPATSQHMAHMIRVGGEIEGEKRVPFYRGLTFHRVIQDFMVQGGCPQGTGLGGPGYSIPAELAEKEPELDERLKHVPGRLSMARSGHYDSAGSQFFICVAASPQLDGEYTVFGEVTRGMEVAFAISEVATGAKDKPIEDVTIELIELLPAGK